MKLNLETIDHPTYSPDLSPTDYHLFPNLDNFSQEKISNFQQAIKSVSSAFIGSRSQGFYAKSINELHGSANNGFVFVVGKQKIISGVIFDVEPESGIRISLSRQDFEIFEVMCSKNGVFCYF